VSRWLFDKPHLAATAASEDKSRWRVDLALLTSADFLAAALPREPGFQFDAFLEFAYSRTSGHSPGACVYDNDPDGGRNKVIKDVTKVGRYLKSGACRVGYAIIFEECDWHF
jgi:hypothetical protein